MTLPQGSSSPQGISRQRQVELLTEGVALPLKPLQERHLRVIALGLARAWDELMIKTAGALLFDAEAEVNAQLCIQLNKRIPQDPCLNLIVYDVSRGEETHNFDGAKLEKRPDLQLKLTRADRRNFPLVAECKLLDPDKDIHLYCSDGLVRFLKGDYAWMAREAFMIAYVRDGSTLESVLTPHLKKYQLETPDRFATQSLPRPVDGVGLELRRSSHARGFRYPYHTPDDPGPIEVWHLWLLGPQATA